MPRSAIRSSVSDLTIRRYTTATAAQGMANTPRRRRGKPIISAWMPARAAAAGAVPHPRTGWPR